MSRKKKNENVNDEVPEPKESDVQKVRNLINSLGSAFIMAAAPMRPQLQQQNMDVEPSIYYPDEGRSIYIGLKLVFPSEREAKYFMKCAEAAKEGE